MEVILLEKVANLGNLGDKVNIKGGYARNFLLPQGKATQHGLLGLDRVRRHLQGCGFQVVLLGAGDLVHRLDARKRNSGKNNGHGAVAGTVPDVSGLPRTRICPPSPTDRIAYSATMISFRVVSTSVCRCTATSNSPVLRSAPLGRRTSAFSSG